MRNVCPSIRTLRCLVALFMLGAMVLPSRALDPSSTFTEDFGTATYQDAMNTTATWDTSAGEVSLPPYVSALIGNYDTSGSALDVVVDGNLAYVADGTSGLKVIDISNPASPVLLGSYDTPTFARGVDVAGNLAFVADQSAGLFIIDVSDPTAPALVGSYDTPGFARDVAIAGGYAYVADGATGLLVISVADPANPSLDGSYDTPDQALAVAVTLDHVLVADQGTGILVMSVADPADPGPIGTYDTAGAALDVEVVGDRAFVADGNAGLIVLDISDLNAPTFAGSYDTPNSAQGVAVAGDRAVVADGFSGLLTFDIADPDNPILRDTMSTSGFANRLAIDGGLVFVADQSEGLQVVRVATPTTLQSSGSYDPAGATSAVAVAGDIAYVTNSGLGIASIDISDPTQPALIASNSLGDGLDIAVVGDVACVAAGTDGLRVFDISDPASIVLLGSRDTTGNARGIALDGEYVFIADENAGLHIMAITNPSLPSPGWVVDTPGEASGVALAGRYVFVADGLSGLQVIDVSDITNPAIVGTFSFGVTFRGVAVSGDRAYLASGADGLFVVDISDPVNPSLLAGTWTTGDDARDVAVSGNLLILAHSGSSLGSETFDISGLGPVRLDRYPTPFGQRVAVDGDRAFVADHSGLKILQLRNGEVALETATAQSLDIGPGLETIVRARVRTGQAAGVTASLSSDGGSNWFPAPEAAWTRIDSVGFDLRWRAELHWSATVNPTLDSVTVDWLSEAAPILALTDVPNDQGGWLRLSLCRSAYDFADETQSPVAGYQVYRRVDDAVLKDRLLDKGTTPSEGAGPFLSSLGSDALRIFNGREFVLGDEVSRKKGVFPTGTWEIVGNVLATQQESYSVVVSTTADSTAQNGAVWSTYFVTTHTTTPSLWFASEPDSAYSLDNLLPEVPSNLQFSGPSVLAWDAAAEDDFGYHSVYGSENASLDGTAILIDYTVVPSLDVSAWAYGFYHVTTSDHAGNESAAASISDAPTSVPVEGPSGSTFFLHPPWPNPSRSGTTIEFDLPRSEPVSLDIFDVRGRRVREIASGNYSAGRHRVSWDGVDQTGRAVASGTYFARIRSGAFEASRRLVIVP